MLTSEQISKLLDYNKETGKLYWRVRASQIPAGTEAGYLNGYGYRIISIKKKMLSAHRIVWLLETSEWPSEDLDHINLDKADNRFCNLRLATDSQNGANKAMYARNTSGLKGVSWHKGGKKWKGQKWRATCGPKHIGYFDCPAAARLAYIVEADKMYGEFFRAA